MELYGGYQKIGVVWPPFIDFVARHDLVFGLLQFDHFSKLVGLGGPTLANDLRGRLEQANRLSSLPSKRVSPRKMRALVCFITCLTNGTMPSISWRSARAPTVLW
jgi:hypothetical protein